MQIIRYAGPDGVRVGVTGEAGPRVLPVASIAELLSMPLDRMRPVVEAAGELAGGAAGEAVDGSAGGAARGTARGPVDGPARGAVSGAARGPLRALPPVDGLTEVWACGVTYERSSDARQEESDVADVYARVYTADRPELFFKSPAWRVCGDGEPIGIRPDSKISVPEPELALVCNAAAEIVGVTICDDVSSRDIEGQNPLYLPQAKIYAGACAIGPGITPVWELDDLGALAITVAVRRGGAVVWSGSTSTGQLHRELAELVEYLFRSSGFPQGVILSTGTGLVPELSFTLAPGDEVEVGISGVGTLTNVVRLTTGFGWLTPDPDRAPGGNLVQLADGGTAVRLPEHHVRLAPEDQPGTGRASGAGRRARRRSRPAARPPARRAPRPIRCPGSAPDLAPERPVRDEAGVATFTPLVTVDIHPRKREVCQMRNREQVLLPGH